MKDLNVHVSGLSDIDACDLYDFFHCFLCLYNSDLYVCASVMTSDELDLIDSSDVISGNKKFGEIYE